MRSRPRRCLMLLAPHLQHREPGLGRIGSSFSSRFVTALQGTWISCGAPYLWAEEEKQGRVLCLFISLEGVLSVFIPFYGCHFSALQLGLSPNWLREKTTCSMLAFYSTPPKSLLQIGCLNRSRFLFYVHGGTSTDGACIDLFLLEHDPPCA